MISLPTKVFSWFARARTPSQAFGPDAADERGVVVVLVACMLVVILGMAALAVDVGSFYQAQRQAQAAADAGALAASQDLPTSTNAASQDGTTYAQKNFPSSTVAVTPDYNGSTTNVQVKVTAQTPTFFGQIFGMTSATVSATAVAGGNGSAAPAAVFAHDDTCSDSGVAFNGNNVNINGSVISNGSLSDSTNPHSSIGTGTYGGPNGCQYSGSDPYSYGPTVNAALQAFPEDFRTTSPTCTFTAASFTWSSNNKTIPPGVYCATGNITLSGNHLSGQGVTFIADNFVITGQNMTLSAPTGGGGLLFWETGTQTMDIEPNSLSLQNPDGTNGGGGTIFAPTATVQFDGNTTGTGFVEANDVIVNGNNFSVTGWGPVMGGNGNSLIQ
jgi:Flp pilus assembly protein TadG